MRAISYGLNSSDSTGYRIFIDQYSLADVSAGKVGCRYGHVRTAAAGHGSEYSLSVALRAVRQNVKDFTALIYDGSGQRSYVIRFTFLGIFKRACRSARIRRNA